MTDSEVNTDSTNTSTEDTTGNEDIDLDEFDVEVESDYWVDYNLGHHGIEYCWQNNHSQVLLAVENSISQIHANDFDVILLSPDGEYLGRVDSCENRPDALQVALELQDEYPKGQFPQIQDDEDADTTTESTTSSNGAIGIIERIRSLF